MNSKQKLEPMRIDKKVRLLQELRSLSISVCKVLTCGREFI